MAPKLANRFEDTTQKKIINEIVKYARAGNIWGIREILRQVPEPEQGTLLNKYDQFGDTALVVACSNGHVALTQYLLNIPGVDPNVGTENTHFTPLILAAANGRRRIVEMLLLCTTPIDAAATAINKMNADEEALYSAHPDIAAMIRSKR